MVFKVVVIALVIVWCAIIFLLSNSTGEKSTKDSQTIIIKVYNRVKHSKLKKQELARLNVILRKCMHAVVFCVLGILFFLCLKTFGVQGWKLPIISLAVTSLYACFDEIHKKFVKGRHCDFSEVMIDIFGACAGVLLLSIFIH